MWCPKPYMTLLQALGSLGLMGTKYWERVYYFILYFYMYKIVTKKKKRAILILFVLE
jgi:hypothetical protein